MPSKPRPLPNRILVRHENGTEKQVLRSQYRSLSSRWKRVTDAERRRATKKTDSEPQNVPAEQPDTNEKE